MATWEYDVASESFTFNDRCYQLQGTSATEMGGYRVPGREFISRWVHPEDAPHLRSLVRQAMSEQDSRPQFRTECRLLRADGQPLWVTVWFRVEREASGRVVRLLGVSQDIHERELAEASAAASRVELERTLRFTQSLLAAIPTPVFFKDADGRYLGCNRAFTEVMGVTSEDIRGKTVHECWPSEHAEVYHQRDLDLMRRPCLQVYDFKVRDKLGRVREVIYAKNVFRDESDRVAGIVGAFVDITDRKTAEAALSYRLELERLVTEISTRLVGLGPDELSRGFDEALAAIGRFFGVDRCYVFQFRQGSTFVDNTHEWCAQRVSSEMAELQGIPTSDFPSAQAVIRGEVVQINRVQDLPEDSCERREFEREGIQSLVMVPLAGHGRVLGFWGLDSVRQVRSWNDDDMALLRTVGEILGSALERNRAEEQIRELQKLESIGRLAAGIAHDLNNMLTPIIGYAELLERGLGSAPDLRAHAHEITLAGRRSRDLVQQLLAFSRRQTLSMRIVDLRQIVSGVEQLLRRTLRENIEIEVALASEACPVRADVGQIEQIVMNLAVNAQDAMPDGGRLVIEANVVHLDEPHQVSESHLAAGSYVLLSVTDTGVGMDDDTRSHAFEPFFTTKERGHGTGLGLATVYGIVKQHGGSVWLESEPSHGTTCRVHLPAADAEAIEPLTKPVVDHTAVRRQETVMVVEDNDTVRELVARILAHVGCTVLIAGSGRECLEALARHEGPLHLLLTDVIMPDLDGWELFTRVAKQHPNAKALFMSGYTHDVIARHGVAEEGFHFIQKPFSVATLLHKLSEVLDQGQPETA